MSFPGYGVGGHAPLSVPHAVPGARLVVYTPDDEPSEKALARLAEGAELDARFPCWNTHHPERERLAPVAG